MYFNTDTERKRNVRYIYVLLFRKGCIFKKTAFLSLTKFLYIFLFSSERYREIEVNFLVQRIICLKKYYIANIV